MNNLWPSADVMYEITTNVQGEIKTRHISQEEAVSLFSWATHILMDPGFINFSYETKTASLKIVNKSTP